MVVWKRLPQSCEAGAHLLIDFDPGVDAVMRRDCQDNVQSLKSECHGVLEPGGRQKCVEDPNRICWSVCQLEDIWN